MADDAPRDTRALMAKIASLPAERIAEVEDFVDFIGQRERDRSLARGVAASSEPTFAGVWDNPEDAAYDAL